MVSTGKAAFWLILGIMVVSVTCKRHWYIWDRDYNLFQIIRCVRMTRVVVMDTETKLRHINKYIDMHVGTLDFELGLITGLMMIRFRHMLRLYRWMSQVNNLQYDTFHNNYEYWWQGKQFFQHQTVAMSCFNSILTFKHEFMHAVDVYMKKQRELADLKKACKKLKTCRRSMDEDLGPQELEVDYFGHQVPKKPKSTKDRVEDLFQMEKNNIDIPLEKLPKVEIPYNDFEKINDWLEYLAREGIEKNKKKKKDGDDDDFDMDDLFTTEFTTPDFMKSTFSDMPTMPPYRNFNFNSLSDIEKSLKIPRTPKKKGNEKIPWGERGSDFEYKNKVKQQFFDKMRAGFDPKREGIEIDLEDYLSNNNYDYANLTKSNIDI